MTAFRSFSHAIQDCIGNCTACERLCLETIAYCRQQGGNFADPARLATLAMCAEACRDAASAMQRGASEAQVALLHACAVTCERGVKTCADVPEDKLLRACGTACRMAARACTELAHVV